ncbi:hypothetical protein [Thermomonospora cellulosilytica]|uniref:Putative coiled-coil protein SlyX n=1 Tax=Thermomonospora cellulosilytica TaxID=1411118 RepID=A0A7W3N3Y0_9ACTN|nr:hypothetical protein [Thermomonospora cellulosilytica]MBA9007070.1 putative coiled-coil protein SlyX [Thermomonospora cellulosilytica]
MTVVLLVLCMVVGALELWAGKQSKDQARAFERRIDELREQVGKQNGVLVTVGEQLTAELSRVKRDVLPALDDRLRRNTFQIEELGELVRHADDYLKAQEARLHELEQQRITLSAVRRKLTDLETRLRPLAERNGAGPGGPGLETALDRLAELERSGTEIWELQRDLTRTLEDVEDVVGDLLRYAGGELDEAVRESLLGERPGRAALLPGRLWARDPRLHDVLAEVYERCARTAGLRVRFRSGDGDPDGPRRLRYFLAGRTMDELAGAFTGLLISTGADLDRAGLLPTDVRVAGAPHPAERPVPEDETAFKGLLRALHDSDGAVAQIGPLLAVRTREELLCAVLTPSQTMEPDADETIWDPAAVALRLRRAAAHQLWELTEWASRPPTA